MEFLEWITRILSVVALVLLGVGVAYQSILAVKHQKTLFKMITAFDSMAEALTYQQEALDNVISWTVPPGQWAGVVELHSTMRELGSELRDYLIWSVGREAWFKSTEDGYTKITSEAKRFTAPEALLLVLDRSRNADPYDAYALVGVGRYEPEQD